MAESVDSTEPITVLIADDHPLVRAGLGLYLRSRTDIQLVGEAASGDEAVAMARRLRPDIVLMDMVMPGVDGVTATRQIIDCLPATQVIVLTSFVDRKMVRDAFEAGAVGYLAKDIEGPDLIEAIKAAKAGDPPLASEAARALIRCVANPGENPYDLTPREMQVLGMMCQGLSNLDIAKSMYVSRSTVKTQVSHILTKLGVASRTEAVSLAVREQILE